MASYKGKPAIIERSATDLYDRFNDLSFFEERLKQLPPEQLAKVGEVKFTPDSLSINTPQMGQLTFNVIERVAPERVVFGPASSPVPMTMTVNFKALSENTTEVTTQIDVEIPAMLRPMVGPKLQEAADKFGEMMSNLTR